MKKEFQIWDFGPWWLTFLLSPIPPLPPCAFKYSFFQYTVFSIRRKQTWLEYTVIQNYAIFRNHNFRDCVNPGCTCSLVIESSLVRFFSALSLFQQISETHSLMNYCQLMKILWINQKIKLWNYYFSIVIKKLNSNRTAVYKNLLLGSL